jgi:hypothetical protein
MNLPGEEPVSIEQIRSVLEAFFAWAKERKIPLGLMLGDCWQENSQRCTNDFIDDLQEAQP